MPDDSDVIGSGELASIPAERSTSADWGEAFGALAHGHPDKVINRIAAVV